MLLKGQPCKNQYIKPTGHQHVNPPIHTDTHTQIHLASIDIYIKKGHLLFSVTKHGGSRIRKIQNSFIIWMFFFLFFTLRSDALLSLSTCACGSFFLFLFFFSPSPVVRTALTNSTTNSTDGKKNQDLKKKKNRKNWKIFYAIPGVSGKSSQVHRIRGKATRKSKEKESVCECKCLKKNKKTFGCNY